MNGKAEKVFVRLGVSDVVIEMDENYDSYANITIDQVDTYLIGYEDENGVECDEEGTY